MNNWNVQYCKIKIAMTAYNSIVNITEYANVKQIALLLSSNFFRATLAQKLRRRIVTKNYLLREVPT